MKLNSVVSETGSSGPDLLIVHGLYGSARNWGVIAKRMSDRFRVTAVDMRNHGESPWAGSHTYPDMAADLADEIDARSHVVGHSMGGKAAMVLALRHPAKVDRLVVADIAPVAYSHHYDDLIDPILALPLDGIESRGQADHLLRAHIPEDPLRVFLLQNLARDEQGWRWRVNWRAIQRDMEYLTGFIDLPQDWRLELPTLFIRGARSDYIGDPELEVIEAHFSDVEIATVADAGHWLHAENPQQFAAIVLEFLRTGETQD